MMNFLIISGAPDKGKTTMINGIANWLTNELGATLIQPDTLPSFQIDPKDHLFKDFSIVISLNEKKIIIHSATDDKGNIDILNNLINQHPDTEIVITSCRDLYDERQYFFDTIIEPFANFHLEVPRAMIYKSPKYELKINWYNTEFLKLCQYLLQNTPFNVKCIS